MIVGYSVEGSTDRAVLRGLRDRWCPRVDLLEGHFRGSSGVSRRRELPGICKELQIKGANVIVILSDSNEREWRKVLLEEVTRCPEEYRHMTVVGVCLRNVECWLAADPDYIANHFHKSRADFTVEDPKGVVISSFGVTQRDRKENEIAAFVCEAPIRRWLTNVSFEDFYDKLRQKSIELKCSLENLRESEA